jgi:hypothetical protein
LKNLKVNQKQFSEILGVNPSSVDAAKRKGYIIRDEVGLFDLNNPENKAYIKNRGIDIKKIKIPSTVPAGRPITTREPGTITSPADVRTSTELNKELTAKKIRKLDLENDIKLKKYLPTDFVEHFLFRHIELLHTTIERLSMTSLKDYSKKILDEGEVTSQMLNDFQNLYLKACHDTKIRVMAEIKNYNPTEASK